MVKEVVLGYWYGANEGRVYQARRYGSALTTACLYIKLRDTYFDRCLSFLRDAYTDHPLYADRYKQIGPDNPQLRQLALHSIGHALLSRLPLVCGIAIESFAYLYDLTQDAVLVYERAPGGLGACAVIADQEEKTGQYVIHEYLAQLKEDIVKCTCDDRCKYCIAIKGCSEYNDALTRFSLGPLLRVTDPSTMTWGF
jgi:hypothetical protein